MHKNRRTKSARRSKSKRSKKSKRSRKNTRSVQRLIKSTKSRFGYSHNMGPRVYNAHMSDGILLADNAFQNSNPLTRALMAA